MKSHSLLESTTFIFISFISTQLLSGMAKMIRECWHRQANVRLPVLRIKKSLQRLAATVDDAKTDLDSEVYVRIDHKNTNFV